MRARPHLAHGVSVPETLCATQAVPSSAVAAFRQRVVITSEGYDMTMNLKTCLALAFALGAFVAHAAVAQSGSPRQSCKGDIEEFCTDVEFGEGRVMECLREHRDELSTECTTALKSMSQRKTQRPRSRPDADD